MIAIAEATTTQTEQGEWLPGAPPQITPAIFSIDRRIYARAKCGECKQRGLKIAAQHQGRAYRVVGDCSNCGHREIF